MLQEDHLTLAPRCFKVSINTAVCIVMCKHPTIFAPFNGFEALYSSRNAIKPGISVSAREISLSPKSASLIFFTLKSSITAPTSSIDQYNQLKLY